MLTKPFLCLQVQLSRVLLLGSVSRTVMGRPYVPGASVTAVVEEQLRDAKAIIFKKRRRKNSRRLTGHRQQLTALRIMDIDDSVLRGQQTGTGEISAGGQTAAASA